MSGVGERPLSELDQFAATVAHEIRTPLTAVAGEIEVALRRDRSAAEYREVLRRIATGVAELVAISGDLALLNEPVNPSRDSARSTPVDAILMPIVQRYAGNDCVRVAAGDETFAIVTGDEQRLRRAITLVVEHAVRHRRSDARVAVRVVTRSAAVAIVIEALPSGFWPHAWSSLSGDAAAALVAAAAGPARAQGADQHQDPNASGRLDLVAHAFGSVDWAAAQRSETPNSFGLGQLALFVTSSINDRVSVLAEVVIEASAATTEVTVDLERLQLTYRANDYLNISAGRYHTGIGFYNAAFHHGSYFETAIGRPRIFRFEDEGGVLPIHEVGVSVRGKVPKTDSALHYVAELGNGRRWTDVDDLEGLDQNRAKSTNVGVSVRPESWGGVEVGTSFYRDDIPDGTSPTVDHEITAVYGVYRTPATELMAEWLRLSYHREGGFTTDHDHGGYIQASQAFGKLRPYYRYDRLDINPATPFIGDFGSSTQHVLGLRLDPAQWIGIKSQYERIYENGGPGANGVHVQLVFVF